MELRTTIVSARLTVVPIVEAPPLPPAAPALFCEDQATLPEERTVYGFRPPPSPFPVARERRRRARGQRSVGERAGRWSTEDGTPV